MTHHRWQLRQEIRANVGNMVDTPAETVFTRGMEATTTERLLNITPCTITFGSMGATYIDRSNGSDGNNADGLACAIRRAIRGHFRHIEATDVRTGERFYMEVAR